MNPEFLHAEYRCGDTKACSGHLPDPQNQSRKLNKAGITMHKHLNFGYLLGTTFLRVLV